MAGRPTPALFGFGGGSFSFGFGLGFFFHHGMVGNDLHRHGGHDAGVQAHANGMFAKGADGGIHKNAAAVNFHAKGGKGVATAAGMLLGLYPPAALLALASWALTFYLTRTSSLASLIATPLTLPLLAWQQPAALLPMCVLTALIGLLSYSACVLAAEPVAGPQISLSAQARLIDVEPLLAHRCSSDYPLAGSD